MPRYEDLTGQRFGRLTVLEATDQKSKDNRRIWKCLCDCGNIKFATCHNLKRGDCTSCGCKNKEQITILGHSNALDISGKRYGKLTAIKKAEQKLPYSNSIAWICKCDCGNEIIVPVSALNSGNTTSCGCSHKSQGEELIKQILLNENIKFETEKYCENLKSINNKYLRFDFYLPDYNYYIEFDGEQHYKIKNNRYVTYDEIQRDFQKNEYCLLNNIKLFRIPYYDLKFLKNYNFKELIQDKYLVKNIDHYNLKG